MIQTIIQNNETGQTAVADLPQSRMNMAGMLASIGIRQPAYEIPCHDDEEGGIQVKLNGRDRFEAQVVAAVRETDTLASVNAVCEMFCSLPYDRQQELRADIEENGLASLKVFAEKMTHLDQSDVSVSYYCPLTADLYERNEWGDMSDDPLELDGDLISGYEQRIREALMREQDGDDMAAYFDEDNAAVSKLRAVEWDVESVGGVLYGKITAHLTELFTDEEEAVFLDWVSGQNSDGLGEGFEQRAIRTGDGEMYVHLWNPDDSWFLCREDQLDEHIEHNYGMGGMT